MDRVRTAASVRIIIAAGIVLAVMLLAGEAAGWAGTAHAQTVPTAPPPSNTPAPPSDTPAPPAATKTSRPAAAFTPTVTLTAAPTDTAVPTTAVPPTETETPVVATATSVPTPTPVPAPSPAPVPLWFIGGIALAILLLLMAAWLIARRRG